MPRLFTTKELTVVTDNKVGTLARVCAPIAEARININACNCSAVGGKAEFRFITADNEKARAQLERAGFQTTERDVVVVETTNESGTLFRAAQQLAQAGVDLDACYATAGSQGSTWIVFVTKTLEKAMNVIP